MKTIKEGDVIESDRSGGRDRSFKQGVKEVLFEDLN